MQLTYLLGRSVGLLRGAGHHAGGDRDAGLLQQPDAHVLVQGEVPLLLLGHMASKQTRRTAQNLDGQEEREQEIPSE